MVKCDIYIAGNIVRVKFNLQPKIPGLYYVYINSKQLYYALHEKYDHRVTAAEL